MDHLPLRPGPMKSSVVLVAAILALATSAVSAQSTGAGTVPVYDATQLALDRYTVIARLGVEGWESAFRIRGYGDLESARQALVSDAARRGADGVINLTCFDQTDRIFKPAGYYCYGNAIKIRNERRLP
jgi:hypothetical protein